jgi:PIN like domain
MSFVSPPEQRPDARPDGAGKPGEDHRLVIEFFIDRSLGRKHLAQALGDLGFTVHTMTSVYGERVAQELDDEHWLADAGRHDWVVLMKDDAIRRRPAERDALADAEVRAFCLTNAQLRAAEQSARFVGNIGRIQRQAEKPGPYVYGVYDGYIKRLWP